MKKFMKYAAITGGICLLIGFIIIVIGIIGGGASAIRHKVDTTIALAKGINNLNIDVDGGELLDVLDELEELEDLEDISEVKEVLKEIGITEDGDVEEFLETFNDLEISGVTINIGSDDMNIFENSKDKYTDGTYTFDNVQAENLEIIVGCGEMNIQYHSEDTIKLVIGSHDQMQCYVENDTVKVIGGLINSKFNSNMTVYLPENISYEEINMEVGAGSIVVDGLKGKNATLEVGMGSLEVTNMNVDTLDASVGMGSIDIQGAINTDGILDCGMGSITMELAGNSKDFNYELECGLGELNVENVYYIAGIGEQSISNNAGKDIEIDCAMGSVEITFTE